MKIIKNGKKNHGKFKFNCNKCGCKFEADTSDYIFIERDKVDWNVYHPTENNTMSDTIKCKCPNCGKEIVKDIYDNSTSNIESRTPIGYFVLAVIGLVLTILESIALMQTMSTKFQSIIGVLACIYLFIDSIVNLIRFIRYTNEF